MTEYLTSDNIDFVNTLVEEINSIKNSFEANPKDAEHKANYIKLIKILLVVKDIDDDEISKRVEKYMTDEPNEKPKEELKEELGNLPNYFKIQNNSMIEKIYDDITNNFRRNFDFNIVEDMENIILCD
uniref:Uncharacterized protein n=1 Tax=viral metagenome TaxID=1070528 RepID=A0A6C0E3F7_9ZZZZ